MGQLTNLYVSSSYQGLLKLTDSTTGLTATLQPVQDGLGGDSPLQISKTQVNISGSLTINGSPVTNVNTGSFVTTSSFNSFTSSIDNRVDGLEAQTSSYITNSQTSSMSVASSSYSNYAVSSSEATHAVSASYAPSSPLPSGVVSGSAQIVELGFATTGSVSSSIDSLSGSIATTDLGQNNRLTSIESKTGSFATTSSLTSLSSSIATTDLNQNNVIAGLATTSSLTSLSSSIATTDLSQNNRLTSLEGVTGSINRNGLITTGSVGGNQSITGSLGISGTLTALSASITYLETVYETASVIYSSGSNQFGDASDDTQTLWGTVNLPTGPLTITGSLHSSDIKGTGSLFLQPNQGDARFVEIYNTSPTDTHITASGGQIFLGDDQTYVKVDNYGSVERIDVVAGNELNVSSSIVNVTGSLNAPSITGSLQGTSSYAIQALSASYAPDTTNTGSLVSNVTNGANPNESVVTVTKGDGTTSNFTINNVTNANSSSYSNYAVSSSQAQNAVSASYANDINRTGLITTGSAASVQSITGSVILSGSAGIELDVKGDQNNTGSLNVSGSLNVNGPVTLLPGGGTPTTPGLLLGGNTSNKLFVSGANNDVYLRSNNDIILTAGNNSNLKISGPGGSTPISSSIVGNTQITGSLILSGSAGAELDVKGDQNVTGSINISGSMNINGKIVNDAVNKGLFIVSSTDVYPAPYAHITSSNDNANIIFQPLTQNGTATGSMFISGSNNILLLGGNALGASGRRSHVGSQNIIGSHVTLNTSSLTIPNLQANLLLGAVNLTLTTGSNAGNQAHTFATNVNTNTITWNHPSASVGAGQSSTVSSNVNVGVVTSITSGPTILTANASLSNNIISNPALALNHISSSIQSTNNIVGGNGLTFNNRYYQTGSNNFLANSANIFAGQGVIVNTAGAPSTNVSRTLVGNIIGGQTVNVSLEANNLDTAGLRNSIVYGQGLNVSGSHSAASIAQNSITLVGRWNGEDNGLADSARTIFAVGTGTGTSNRRTGLYVTSGSLVGVSGSLDVKGNSVMTGSLGVTGNVMFASGSNTTMGTVALDGANPGTATVSNTLVTANSLIYLTKQTNNHPNAGPVVVSSKGSSTFTITSNHNGDTDTVAYLIINPV